MRAMIVILVLAALVGAERARADAQVTTSIVPLQAWATALLGPGPDVGVLIGPGQTPELFEPSARQLTELADAVVLFTVGAPFEQIFIPRVRNMFPDLQIIELGHGIERLGGDAGHSPAGEPDPHVWLDPVHAASIIDEMGATLATRFADESAAIRGRSARLSDQFRALDQELTTVLEPLRGQALLCYHPALGYFAAAYGLHQLAVEEGGTEPGARHLTRLAERMHAQRLQVLVVEPQFAPQRARSMATSMGLDVIVFDPLGSDLITGLRDFASELAASVQVEQP